MHSLKAHYRIKLNPMTFPGNITAIDSKLDMSTNLTFSCCFVPLHVLEACQQNFPVN